MTISIWERIADTPWWVYALFVYVAMVCFIATKPHTVTLKSLYITSAIFIPISIISICLVLPFSFYNMLIWAIATLAGAALGWLQFKVMKIKAIKQESKLHIPGTWSIFLLAGLVLVANYYYGDTIKLDLSLLLLPKYTPYVLAIYGVLSGLFIGKIIYSRRCIKSGPYFSQA